MKQLLFVLALLVPSRSHAEPEWNIALKGGPDAATQAEDNRVNRYGFTGGLASHLQWALTGRFSLGGQMEVLYTPRGARSILDGEYLGRVRLHYVDVTVTARPEARFGPVSVYLLLGGGLNLLASAEKENASGAKNDITGDLHRLDVALVVGAGVALHLPGRELGPFRLGTLFLEGRYDHGLLDSDAVNGGFKNRASSLMFGVSFVLGAGAAPAPATPTNPSVPVAASVPSD
jgi:hypothetical protein